MKTALAMSLACGIAMSLGWENPYWACIAVAVVSLPTVGESFKKCVQRLWGTAVAGAVALGVLALFPQERWPFIFCLSLYVAICAYRITVSRSPYFWFLSGYVSLLIASVVIGTSAQTAFTTAVLRLQETALGIFVYALVSVFLWPQRSADGLEDAVGSLLGVLAKILQASFALLDGQVPEDPVGSWLTLGDQRLGQLQRRLGAAEMEQFAIRDRRVLWRQVIATLHAMLSGLRIWQESAPELRQVDMAALLPDLGRTQAALRRRFSRLQAILDGAPVDETPAVSLHPDPQRLAALPPLRRAAVLTMVSTIQQIETASRTLEDCLLALKGRGRPGALPATAALPGPGNKPADADSFLAFARAMLAVWTAAFIWIYFDPPGHLGFVVFAGLFSLMGVLVPQMDWRKFVTVHLIGVPIAAVLYVFVMPSLSQYTGLSILIFCLIAFISYISWHPRLTALKLAGVVPFIMMTNMQNHQTYDFTLFVDNGIVMFAGMIMAAVFFHLPLSQQPEIMVLRVMGRFFRQAEAFLATCRELSEGEATRQHGARFLTRMRASVAKIGGWANSVDYGVHASETKQDIAALVGSLNSILSSCTLLSEVRSAQGDGHGPAGALYRLWDGVLLQAVNQWAHPLRHADAVQHKRLEQDYGIIRQRIEEAFAAVPEHLAPQEYLAAYRMLGGYRGVHRALTRHAALAAAFDWDRWGETRF